jgi:molybdopterin molybdotransferase
MITVREALASVLAGLPRLGAEQVALTRACGRVLAEPIRAPYDVPSFRNSAMDGYAIRAENVAGASAAAPVVLRVIETVGAGAVPQHRVQPGTATRIMTGAVVPEGADAVVRVEDTRDRDAAVEVRVAVGPGNAVRQPGEDVRAGETVLAPGRLLRPADVGLLASLGVAMVRVVRRPRVTVLVTGDELVEVGEPLRPGQIVNSNAYTLAAAVEEAGAVATVLGIVRDQPELIRDAFAEACSADMVLSTGGVSMGSFDYVRRILQDLGYEERFWRVAQKPGKPLTYGLLRCTPVFGLPGNPVSSLVCFYVYVLPALRTMMGLQHVHLPSVDAALVENVRKTEGLTEFIRCVLEGSHNHYRARSTGSQSSGVLRSMSLGDGLIVGPPEATVLESGSSVRVLLLAPDAGSATAPV